MKKKNNAKRDDITTLPLLPGTLILVGTLFVLFLILSLVLHHYDILHFPEFLETWIASYRQEPEEITFAESFFASLDGKTPAENAGENLYLTMSDENLKEILLAGKMPESLYWKATVAWMHGDDYVSANVHYIVQGDRVYAYAQSAQTISRLLICDTETVYIQENGQGRTFPRTDDFSPLSELGLPSLAHMQKQLANAEDGSYTLTLGETLQSTCIQIRYTDPVTQMTDMWEVLPDCGVVVSVSSTLPNMQTPYYAVFTTSLMTDLQGLDTSIFDIPNA